MSCEVLKEATGPVSVNYFMKIIAVVFLVEKPFPKPYYKSLTIMALLKSIAIFKVCDMAMCGVDGDPKSHQDPAFKVY